MRKLIIAIPFYLLSYTVCAQMDIGLKLTTFNVHPFADNDLEFHQKTIGNSGYLTFEPGITADLNVPLVHRFRAGGEFSALGDRFSGFTASAGVNVSWLVFKYWKHRLFIGAGPKFYVNQSRELPENYTGDEGYKTDGDIAYRLMPITGFAEYAYDISRTQRFVLSIGQTHPHSIGISAGFRFIIPPLSGSGCNCPSYR